MIFKFQEALSKIGHLSRILKQNMNEKLKETLFNV